MAERETGSILVFNRLRLQLFPRIQPDLRASRTRLARAVTYALLGLAVLWAGGYMMLSFSQPAFSRYVGWNLAGIAALGLIGLSARWLVGRGRLVAAGYLLSSALFLLIAIGSMLFPSYVLFFAPAYMLAVLAAAAIIGAAAPYFFAIVSALANVAFLTSARGSMPTLILLRDPATFILTVLVYAGVALAVAAVSNSLSRQVDRTIGSMQEQAERLAKLAHTDPLTGLANRRHFFERLESEFARAQRYRRPFCLLYIDLDGFKAINDRFGHLFGDEILRGSALAMQAILRSTDLLARIGGDEFAVLLPETSMRGSEHVVEKIRRALSAYGKQLSPSVPPLTLSVGVGEINQDDEAIEDILARADKAQYLAKSSGKAITKTQKDLERAARVD